MSFITFNETYYRRKLEIFENKKLTEGDIYEIRQLLKVLDDLTDEGYTNLNNRMETDFSCLSRLRALLAKENVLPFSDTQVGKKFTAYATDEFELSAFLESLMAEAKGNDCCPENPFLDDIYQYCKWIENEEEKQPGIEKDTAYVFLLRDTLLPYVYFRERYKEHVYPLLISRRFLEDISGIEYVDDDIRLSIYEALENGYTDYGDFCDYCRKEMLRVLDEHDDLKQTLLILLNSLKEKRIVVIESGYMGTFPMMLKALDDRVTFRLYTTAPFLYDIYSENIFCRRYEDIRKFETVYVQNLLIGYASFRDGQFYVNISKEEEVKKKALAEISVFLCTDS